MGGCCASSNPKAKHEGKRSSRSHDGAALPRQARGGGKESVLLPDLGQSDQSGSKQAASGSRPGERSEPGPFRTAEQGEDSLLIDPASDHSKGLNKGNKRGVTANGSRNDGKPDQGSSNNADQPSLPASGRLNDNSSR